MFWGIILAVASFIYLTLRGMNVILVSIICSLLVVVTSGLNLGEAFSSYYPFGKLGAFTFAGRFFFLFIAGAIFGRVMGASGAATSIAQAMIDRFGANKALVIATMTTALLTYGGVVVFVVIFAMYPLGLRLLKQADIPKRLFVAALALGSGTFTMSALPGTPSIQNVISASRLGTDLFAGAGYGLFGGALMLLMGLYYLESQRKSAAITGEGFRPSPNDSSYNVEENLSLPSWKISLIPILSVLGSIMLPRFIAGPESGLIFEVLNFAKTNPILWPSIALLIGVFVSVILFKHIRPTLSGLMGKGVEDAIIPLIATSAVIGFGGVVTQTEGFFAFTQQVNALSVPPAVGVFLSVSVAAAIVGSGSGGLQIFMETMAQDYLDKGMDPELLHRIATMACGGFDSLPHCGAVVAVLAITGMTHKEGYKDIGIITVVIPVIATLATIALTGFI